MRKLAAWLKGKKIPLTEFAGRVGVTHTQLSRVLNGKRRPSLQLMQRIKDETAGYITLDDFSDQARAAEEAEASRQMRAIETAAQ